MNRGLPALVLAGGLAGAALWLNSAPPGSPQAVVNVPPGASASRVADFLEKNGHIRSRRWFLLLVRLRGASSRIRVGFYEIRPGQSASRILSDLVTGRARRIRVTVPEGFASWQIAERLENQGVCGAEAFRLAVASAAAEGFLFPDTYDFAMNTPAETACRVMRDRFEEVWASVVETARADGHVREVLDSTVPAASRLRLADGRLLTRTQAATLASLIEREARRPEERTLISAVFHNRLKKRMFLESDPTVQFSLGHWKERILYRDLDVESPYNTYRRLGLPPGPICSPGRASLAAALAPAPVNLLYFVADESGGHVFAATYGEHLKNVRQRDQERRARRRAAKAAAGKTP